MNSHNRVFGVILAAGRSSRMGRDKALLPWPPSTRPGCSLPAPTLLSAAISVLKMHTDAVIVVAGRNAAALAPVVSVCGAKLVVNPDPDRGQFSSLQTGLREAVNQGCDAAMIMPVDCPPLPKATLKRLRTEFERAIAAGKWGVAPENNGRHGHPLVAGRALIDAFLTAPVSSNAREVKRAHAESIEYLAVAEPGIGVDLNTPQDYKAVSSWANE
ncbi:MAG: nucleotidyltransferase family protein [Terracidiphilus sp.]